MVNDKLKKYIDKAAKNADSIEASRKESLLKVADYISARLKDQQMAYLVFMCTHNSRRSIISQTLAKAAAAWQNIQMLRTYSGGLNATEFSPIAADALDRTGLKVVKYVDIQNSPFNIFYDDEDVPVIAFSKVYNAPSMPREGFALITNCSESEKDCPNMPGTEVRISLGYDDPLAYEGKSNQDGNYDKLVERVATEMAFMMKQVKQ